MVKCVKKQGYFFCRNVSYILKQKSSFFFMQFINVYKAIAGYVRKNSSKTKRIVMIRAIPCLWGVKRR